MAKEKCNCYYHHHTWKMLIVGLLVLANAKWLILRWDTFIGALLVLGGLIRLVMPCNK